MGQYRVRKYRIDGDELEIIERFHQPSGNWIGDFSVFDEDVRYTPNGRPWVDITCGEECPHCDAWNNGGKCSFFKREQEKDLIGVCFCNEKKLE